MALLDYMFPMGQSNPSITGLLGEEEAKRIRQQSQISGLLNFGANLLAASGPTNQPMSFGQRLAPAILGGYQAAQGATNQQIQDQLALQKAQREQGFRKAVEGAFTTQPLRSGGLTQSGPDSQLGLLSRPEFGGGFADQETVSALRANPNLPTERTLDQSKFMSALAEYNPLEFAKLQAQAAKPGEDPLALFKAFSKLPEDQQRAYAAFKQLTTPQTNITANLTEKGADKIIGERVGEFSSAAASARRFASDASVISSVLKGKGGGDVVKIGTALAKDLGFQNEQVTAQDLANSIAIRGATTMRAPGSGATSDLEFKSFQAAFPSLSNSEPGRAFMANASTKFAQRSAKLSDYAMKLYRKGEYSEEAIANYDQSLGPVIDLREMESLSRGTQAAPTQRRDFTGRANK